MLWRRGASALGAGPPAAHTKMFITRHGKAGLELREPLNICRGFVRPRHDSKASVALFRRVGARMAQPGQAARLRQIRTLARNALLKVKMFLDKWGDLVKDGRGQLEASCNTITRVSNWPLICTHSLKECKDLRPSGTRALRRRYIVAKEALNACVAEIRTAVEEASNVVSTQIDVDTEEPLFACATGQNFFGMLQNIIEQHEQQLEVGIAAVFRNPLIKPCQTADKRSERFRCLRASAKPSLQQTSFWTRNLVS